MNIKSIAGGLTLASALLAACSEPVEPPVPGSIIGTVSIEGTGVDGVTVTLEGTTSTTTSAGGAYRFDNVDAGIQTVTISRLPPESDFPEVSISIILEAGQTQVLDFDGSYVRTAAIEMTNR